MSSFVLRGADAKIPGEISGIVGMVVKCQGKADFRNRASHSQELAAFFQLGFQNQLGKCCVEGLLYQTIQVLRV